MAPGDASATLGPKGKRLVRGGEMRSFGDGTEALAHRRDGKIEF